MISSLFSKREGCSLWSLRHLYICILNSVLYRWSSWWITRLKIGKYFYILFEESNPNITQIRKLWSSKWTTNLEICMCMCIYLNIIKIVKTLYIDSWVFDYLISKTMLIGFFRIFPMQTQSLRWTVICIPKCVNLNQKGDI